MLQQIRARGFDVITEASAGDVATTNEIKLIKVGSFRVPSDN